MRKKFRFLTVLAAVSYTHLDLATFGGEAKRLLQDLQTRNERLFLVTILIMNTATNRQKLENAVFQTAAIAQKYNCALKRLDFQQEEGLMSSLPIGVNQVEIERGLTTSSTAVFVPFTTQELFQGGEALYYLSLIHICCGSLSGRWFHRS